MPSVWPRPSWKPARTGTPGCKTRGRLSLISRPLIRASRDRGGPGGVVRSWSGRAVAQVLKLAHCCELAQRLDLDLTHALARETELAGNVVGRAGGAAPKPEAEAGPAARAPGGRFERAGERGEPMGGVDRVDRVDRILVLE